MLTYPKKIWRHLRDALPRQGFHFDRPLVVLQSDDWGRVGLRDQQGFDQLHSSGIDLGERPYDFYTLETADDLAALQQTLSRHRDSAGRPACIEMNFILANPAFDRVEAENFREIYLHPLAEGLPLGWNRPRLFEAYREGVAARVFIPALHGTTHFCRPAVERHITGSSERGALLRTLWQAGTPYIHWRMPWVGYEYWDPESDSDGFLPAEEQSNLIGQAVGAFSRMFSMLPRSACAPGYRANEDTQKSWAQFGIQIAQNGPDNLIPPHFDRNDLLHLYRTVEFEPATDPNFSLEVCLQAAETCFQRGIPAIVSLHSINFHSSVRDFRSRTLTLLDQFLSALEAKHTDLLYLHDHEILELVQNGCVETEPGARVNVTKNSFTRSTLARGVDA